MDGEIILDRGSDSVMKLNDNEQAMMDEIQLDFTKPRSHMPPTIQQMHGRGRHEVPNQIFQEDVDAFANPVKQNTPLPPRNDEPVDHGEYVDETEYDNGHGTGIDYGSMEGQEEVPSPGYKTIDEEKSDLVNKLGRLEKRGFNVNKRLNAYSPIDELRTEVKRITYSIEVDKSVKFSRRMLIACVTGLEFLNKRYNPFEIQLEGWSENVMETQDDYDEVFEELFVKYRTKMHVAPEVKLIMMLGGSAMMFHLTNSMFKQVMPNVNDIMKQNPDLMNNMMSAVQNTMSNQAGPSTSPASSGDRYEMKGPGLDISSLMGGIMMPPTPPMNTSAMPMPRATEYSPEVDNEEDDISDIVSEGGDATQDADDDIKEVKLPAGKSKRGRKKKVEINL
jgi:hypothetical protein|tara:strand:- start:134 stop:1306 length:1173 start_codon:yes stop_codon:yes gene_type:complete